MIGRLLKAQMKPGRAVSKEELAFHEASVEATNRKSATMGCRAMLKAMAGEPEAVVFNAMVELASPLIGKLEAFVLADEVLKKVSL